MAKKVNYVLSYSLWNDLDYDTKEFFRDLFEIEARAKYFFEMYFYKLNIIHELSHALFHHYEIKHDMYEEEQNVNHIAVAYFKTVDPQYIEKIKPYIERASSYMAKPEIGELSLKDYFIKHYEEIGPKPKIYGYFQFLFVLNALSSDLTLTDAFNQFLNINVTLKKSLAGIKADTDTPKAVYETWDKVLDRYGIKSPKVKIKQEPTPSIQNLSWTN